MTPKKSTPPTQNAVARLVGLSRATVSHILSGREMHRYSEETRRRVLEAAEKLGYRPNRAAQMIRRGKSRLIGVVHFGTSTHQARQMAHYLPQAIQRNDYQPFVVDLSWQGDSYQTALERLIEMRVEGVIIAGLVNSFTEKDLRLLQHCGIPTVLLATSTTLNVPAVFRRRGSHLRRWSPTFLKKGIAASSCWSTTINTLPRSTVSPGFATG